MLSVQQDFEKRGDSEFSNYYSSQKDTSPVLKLRGRGSETKVVNDESISR